MLLTLNITENADDSVSVSDKKTERIFHCAYMNCFSVELPILAQCILAV